MADNATMCSALSTDNPVQEVERESLELTTIFAHLKLDRISFRIKCNSDYMFKSIYDFYLAVSSVRLLAQEVEK